MAITKFSGDGLKNGLIQRKLPIIMLIDTSSSMSGLGIQQVNVNLKEYINDLKASDEFRNSIVLSIVTFNSTPDILADFVPLESFTPANLHTSGSTDLASGIDTVMSLIDHQRSVYLDKYKRALFVVISDGNPDPGNKWKEAIKKINADHIMSRAVRIALGAGSDDDINDTTLEAFILNREIDRAVRIGTLQNFREFFKYLRTVTIEMKNSKPISTPVQAGCDSVALVSGN